MIARSLSSLVVGVVALTAVVQASSTPTCSAGQKCPADLPCCSQYGECGIGSTCTGGCDPRFSYAIDSCMPAPQCVNQNYTFTNVTQSLQEYTSYLGNSDEVEWTYSGYPLQYGENLLLTMPANSAGSVIMSTKYVWYGKVSCTMKTSRDQGVVSAFMYLPPTSNLACTFLLSNFFACVRAADHSFLSDVKDEIDYEFVGADLTTAQTNIYWQALPYYGNSGNISNLTDTFSDWHTYTVDWQPDQIQWSVDGTVGRTKTLASTWNSTSQLYNYPQTPARVQLSIWPGGASDQAAGTIAWAGGAINWDSQDIQSAGYYYMQVQSCSFECYSPPTTATKQGDGSVSYVYDTSTTEFLNNSVILSDQGTELKSELGSGTNTTAAPPPGVSVTSSASGQAQIDGGGSADGDRGSDTSSGSSGSASTGTSFQQGGESQASTFRGVSRVVAVWSVVLGVVVGGMFTLL